MKTQRLTFVLFISLVLFMSFKSFAQTRETPVPFDQITQKFTYTDVVSTNLSQYQAYNNARNWFTGMSLFRNFSNRGYDSFSGRGVVHALFAIGQIIDLEFNIVMEFKDNRYKFTITNIVVTRFVDDSNYDITLEKFFELYSRRRVSGERRLTHLGNRMFKKFHASFQELIISMDEGVKGARTRPQTDW
jgi:hypothetical protein